MFRKILTWLISVVSICFTFIILIPTIIFASIYFILKPDKLKQFNEEINVEKTESNNTGIH